LATLVTPVGTYSSGSASENTYVRINLDYLKPSLDKPIGRLTDISKEDVETLFVSESPESTDITPPSDPPKVESIISLNALTSFSAPQTLKLFDYIKHQKVIILVDSGTIHNFIHRCIAQETHCYIHAVNNFEIMISNGGSMKCGGRCENVRLQIGDYHLKSHMFSINMGGCDIVLGVD
jgi:hypothetical protein